MTAATPMPVARFAIRDQKGFWEASSMLGTAVSSVRVGESSLAGNSHLTSLPPRKTMKIKFPTNSNTQWFITAGKITHLSLQFLNKQISLSFTIKDWQFEKYPMSYENDAISATQLKFTLNTYTGGETERINGVKHTVIKLTSSSTAGSYIATGSFKIFTPVNGVLTVGLGGNADDFNVTLQSGDATYGGTESITINPSRDGGKITLSIRPVGTPAHGSRCFLHFGVRNNGRDSEADSEINRDAYIVEFP